MNPDIGLQVAKVSLYMISILFTVVISVNSVYFLIISIFGWVRRKEPKAEDFPIKHTFALLVAAHNEESVIANIVKCLKALEYPKDMYDVFVIADNCTDRTAEIARENGAIVYERSDDVKRGKGFSLEWMFKNLFALERQYDAVSILDADNLVSSNYLLEMNKHLSMGQGVIQGYLDSKNPQDSWISAGYSITYWVNNRMFQLARYYLGLNCALGGTGFVMRTDILKEMGWGATSLTEDLEFTMKLVLRNMRVTWAHDAKVYDEKPLHMKQSWRQRKRWLQGHWDCAFRYMKDLLKKAMNEKDFAAFDMAVYLLQPLVIIVGGISIVSGWFYNAYEAVNDPGKFTSPWGIFMIILTIVLTYVFGTFIIIEKKFTWKILLYYIVYPIYVLTWVPISIQGFIHRNQKEWVHTIHTRSMDAADLDEMRNVS